MKTFMKISMIATLCVMIVFVSSCSTQKGNDFASRKYYNFPRNERHYVSKKTEPKNRKENVSAREQNTKVSNVAVEIPAQMNEKPAEITKKLYQPKNTLNKIQGKQPLKYSVNSGQGLNEVQGVGDKKHFFPNSQYEYRDVIKKKIRKMLDPGSTELAVLAFLCIFIPPLAVYLKQKYMTKWFWVTLVLCVASTASFFLSILGGVGWLAAIAIALLVVFDMIK